MRLKIGLFSRKQYTATEDPKNCMVNTPLLRDQALDFQHGYGTKLRTSNPLGIHF